jgi:hypothetical protein
MLFTWCVTLEMDPFKAPNLEEIRIVFGDLIMFTFHRKSREKSMIIFEKKTGHQVD